MNSLLFPAYAGVILDNIYRMVGRMTFPRIRGGDPVREMLQEESGDFSPHTRG